MGESVEILWQWNVGDAQIDIAQASDGTLLAIGQHQITSLDPATGQFNWQKTLADPDEEINSPPAIGDGKFYVGIWHDSNKTKRLAAFDLTTGNELWTVDSNPGLLAIWGDYVINPEHDKFSALLQSDGSTQWVYNAETMLSQSCVIRNSTLYTFDGDSNDNFKIVGLNVTNGQKVITFNPPPSGNWTNQRLALGSENTINAFTPNSGQAYGINAETGDWTVGFSGVQQTETTVVGEGNLIYYEGRSFDGVYAFNATTGEESWRYAIPDANTGARNLSVASDGTLYFVYRGDDSLHAVDGNDLTTKFLQETPQHSPSLKWSISLGVSSYIIGQDGTVFVGGQDGKVTAIKGSAGVGNAPWPMFGGNAQRTFTSPPSSAPGDQTDTQTPGTFTLEGWSWLETYPWIYNNDTGTWYYMMPVVGSDGVATNFLYNYTTKDWKPIQSN